MPDPRQLQTYCDFAQRLAHNAGAIMIKHFATVVPARFKEDHTPVTIADEQINAMVIAEIAQAFPEHAVHGEEASRLQDSPWVWVCDPIDGTLPFTKGVPVSVFSLALVHDGLPLVGVVFDPFCQRTYKAIRGQGAWCDDQRLSVSEQPLGRGATVDVEWWPSASFDLGAVAVRLTAERQVQSLHLGSVTHACCLVASGAYEGCLFAGTTDKHVDVAAVEVIVTEAGGLVSDLRGQAQRYDRSIFGAVVGNRLVHEELVRYAGIDRLSGPEQLSHGLP